MNTFCAILLILSSLSSLSSLSNASNASNASNLDKILEMHGILPGHTISSSDKRLPSIMNIIIGQLSAYHVFNNEMNEMNNQENKDKVETLFLVKSYDSYNSPFSMMVLTNNSEYYVVTSEKTYYISEEEYNNLQKTYKFFYYENMDSFSKLTLEDIERFMFTYYYSYYTFGDLKRRFLI